jgi:hypothetical protein
MTIGHFAASRRLIAPLQALFAAQARTPVRADERLQKGGQL